MIARWNVFLLFILFIFSITSCTPISNNVGGAGIESKFAIVVDAGSSGSRAYLYTISKNEPATIVINKLDDKKNNIALASFVNKPTCAGKDGILPLLNAVADKLVEQGVSRKQIVVSVLGTAGMRLLNQEQQQEIYTNVVASIKNDGFSLGKVKTISGEDEGLYSWADVNYLNNDFKSNTPNGIVEVGGASMQVAFTTNSKEPSAYIKTIKVNNKEYSVYVVSFLGLGQDQAREQMNSLPTHNQCYPLGYTNGTSIDGRFKFDDCLQNYAIVLANDKYKPIYDINRVPGFTQQNFIGLSSVYYALNFWKMGQPPSEAKLQQNINNTCYKAYHELEQLYPEAYKLYNQCANAVYEDLVLYSILKMHDEQLIVLDKINGEALTWTLGYLLLNN